MHFNKAEYKIAKDRIIRLIQDSHDWKKTEGFIADGVICPDVYEKQPMRILCVLAESYGYDECEMTDIEAQLTEDIIGVSNGAVKTTRILPSLLWLLQRSFENGAKVAWEEFFDLRLLTVNTKNTTLLQITLSKVAWINVKKASRSEGTEMDSEEVYTHALKNQEILREQIQAIAPHLMIVCGETAFRALHHMKLLGSEVTVGKKWQFQGAEGEPRVIEVSHPCPRGRDWRGYEQIYENFERIYNQIQFTDCKA